MSERRNTMKKIALDLDGVVFDSENLYRVYTKKLELFNKFKLLFNIYLILIF